jgi:hypothetical protein
MEEFDENSYDIETRSKISKEASPYTLIFQKEAFGFDSKRELYSFLAKKDKSAAIYLAQVIIAELNKEYTEKFGENFRKDNTIWNDFEEDIEDELEVNQLSPALVCFICTFYPDQCEYEGFDFPHEKDIFNLKIYDDAYYNGEDCLLFDDSTTGYYFTQPCFGTNGFFPIQNLTCDNQNWDNKISSFIFKTELPHSSSVLTFYSERGSEGAELVYYLPEGETRINQSDLFNAYWTINNHLLSIDNSISSISYNFHVAN